MGDVNHLKQELSDFLRQECHKRGLSMRRLSISSGLSPATVHNILKREYQPTLTTLNLLADYLGVRRQYLWQLAGLLEDMDCGPGTDFTDTRLESYLARVDRLPDAAKNLVITLVGAVIAFLEAGETEPSVAPWVNDASSRHDPDDDYRPVQPAQGADQPIRGRDPLTSDIP